MSFRPGRWWIAAISTSAAFCADISTGAGGVITGVTVRQQNLNYFETSGIDLEAAYRFPLASVAEGLPGNVSLRLLANYVDKLATTVALNATTTDSAGQYSTPDWTIFGTLGYDLGAVSTTLDLRYFGGGTIDNTRVVGTGPGNININDVASSFLTNLTMQYDFGKAGRFGNTQVYLRVNNLFNQGRRFRAREWACVCPRSSSWVGLSSRSAPALLNFGLNSHSTGNCRNLLSDVCSLQLC